MKKRKTLTITALILSAGLMMVCMYSCFKEFPTYYIPEEMKTYIDFPEGSYWIYEDSLSGRIDSVYLLERTSRIMSDDAFQIKYEHLSQRHFFSAIDDIYKGWTDVDFTYSSNHCSFVYTGMLSHYIGEIPVGKRNQEVRYAAYYDSLPVNGIRHKRVKQMQYFLPDGTLKADYYWAPDVGLIKRSEPADTAVWLLKRYYINK